MNPHESPPSRGRRRLLGRLAAGGLAVSHVAAASELLKPLEVAPSSRVPGAPILEHPYGVPSVHEADVVRRSARAWPLPGAACHGAQGEGGLGDQRVGGQGTLISAKPKRTVGSYWPYATTLFDYIRRAMPYNAPESLSADEVYAVSAYLLNQNGIVPANTRLDAATLPRVVMPNRQGFVADPRPGRL
jgi:hypothetical protein